MTKDVKNTLMSPCCSFSDPIDCLASFMISALNCCLPATVKISDAFLLDNNSRILLRTSGIWSLTASTAAGSATFSTRPTCRYWSPFSGCRFTVKDSRVTNTGGFSRGAAAS